ncbi:uncharacterized protein [Henckelia pumila]|uniref:uncharacterized protein n=1 Tax=Henckelia pumila TaxID=405737 RepID=UPI003C6E3DA7
MTIINEPKISRHALAAIQERMDAMMEAEVQRILVIQRGEGEEQEKEPEKEQSLGCPFSPEIIKEPLPAHLKSAKIKEYDGSGDPEEHVARFENVVMLHCYNDQIKCKVFLTTLVDSTQRWFENLEVGSIHAFKEFREAFLQHFSSSKRYRKTTLSLFEMKQAGEESLRAYIKKFNKIALEVPACAPETRITEFMQGIKEGELFRSLVKKTPRNFEDLLAQAEKYINMEEAQRQKREKDRREGNNEKGSRSGQGGGKNDHPGRLMAYASQKMTRDRGVHMCEEDVRPASQKRPGKYCSIHRVNTHNTSECRRLLEKVEKPEPEEA